MTQTANIMLKDIDVDVGYHLFDGEIRIDSIMEVDTGKRYSISELSHILYKEAVDKIILTRKNNSIN